MNANDKLNPTPQTADIDPSFEAALPMEGGAASGEPSDAEVMKEGK